MAALSNSETGRLLPSGTMQPLAAAPAAAPRKTAAVEGSIKRRDRERRYRALQELSYDEVQLRLARAEAWLADLSSRLGAEVEIARGHSGSQISVPLDHIETMKGRIDAFLGEDL